MSEIRKDPLTGRGVIIAPERAPRPKQLGADVKIESVQAYPFCPGNENLTPPELWADRPGDSPPDQPGWSVRVVPNKYPTVSFGKTPERQTRDRAAGIGVHEVIIESATHVANLAALDQFQFARVVYAYRQRLRAARENTRWRFTLLFKNHGERAGATFEHTHAQLIALPFVPVDMEVELASAGQYYQRNAHCYFCALLRREMHARARMVIDNAEFLALCPSAPRFAFETWILPRIHTPAFEDTDDVSLTAFAGIAWKVIAALDRLETNPPFNYFIQSLSLDEREREHYHWQFRLLPQFSRAAGFEWGSGLHINPVAPEDAARRLRDAAI
jgi:UDPglucose--hexose-1-phosphate uridylyltransferase